MSKVEIAIMILASLCIGLAIDDHQAHGLVNRLEHSLALRDELVAAKDREQTAAVRLAMMAAIVKTKYFLLNESKGYYDSFSLEDRRYILRVMVQNEFNESRPTSPPVYLVDPPHETLLNAPTNITQ